MKKIISCIFVVLSLLFTFGCRDNKLKKPDKSEDFQTTQIEEASNNSTVLLNIPKSDFNGIDFTILTSDEGAYEYSVNEETGDLVSDAIYRRNRSAEELLNFNLKAIVKPGTWDERDIINQAIRSSVLADDGEFNLVNATTVCTLPIATEGMFLNVLDLKSIDLNNPWWVANLDKTLAIGSRLFGIYGDSSLSLYKYMAAVFFNNMLLEKYNLESPYKCVKDGTWTIDKMIEISEQVCDDLNGDGAIDPENDVFGYYYRFLTNRNIQTSCEFIAVDFDEDGKPFVPALNEKDSNLFFKWKSFLLDNVCSVSGEEKANEGFLSFLEPFKGDRVLFMNERINAMEYMRDMESDFGILPLPKRDEAQERYHTQTGTATSMLFIPRTVRDADMTGIICEALSYYSYTDVVPAYYELDLKVKYTRDVETKNMLNIIRSSAEMGFAFAYAAIHFPSTNDMLSISDKSADIASKYEKNLKAWNASMDKIWEDFAAIEN